MNLPVKSKLKTAATKPLYDAQVQLRALYLQLVELQTQLGGQVDLSLERSIRATHHALSQLEHPTITFATIGTTSSGKSTALNALIGAQIAPMDANELSAGLLTLEHHDGDWQLFAADAHGEAMGGVIATGQKAVYDCLNATMQDVIKRRITHPDAPSPTLDFVVRGPLFICDPDHPLKQQLGDSVRVRIFDLPGLRTVDDSHNAHIIQERINQAFSLVLIDRTGMFDHEKRKSLLKELDKIVHDLGGKDTMMAFLFNKIDIPNPSGKSADEHLREAQEEIRAHLKLRHPERLKLLPFSGILYFHTTCLRRAIEDGDLAQANTLRDQLLQHCDSQLDAQLKRTRPADKESHAYDVWRSQADLYESMKRAQRHSETSTMEQIKQLNQLALNTSAHTAIWDTLTARVRDNIATILLMPVIRPLKLTIEADLEEFRRGLQQEETSKLDNLRQKTSTKMKLQANLINLNKLLAQEELRITTCYNRITAAANATAHANAQWCVASADERLLITLKQLTAALNAHSRSTLLGEIHQQINTLFNPHNVNQQNYHHTTQQTDKEIQHMENQAAKQLRSLITNQVYINFLRSERNKHLDALRAETARTLRSAQAELTHHNDNLEALTYEQIHYLRKFEAQTHVIQLNLAKLLEGAR